MKRSIELSVVIPAYNCRHTLDSVIAKVVSQAKRVKGLEIIVVDDGSTDGTREMLTSVPMQFQNYLFAVFQENSGSSAARNRGIELADGRIVLFLDGDVIPGEGLIDEHIDFHRARDSQNLAFRGKIMDVKSDKIAGWIRPRVAGLKTRKNPGGRLQWIDFISGNISLNRRFLMDNHLRFDEKYFPNEDVEFGFRARTYGLQIYYGENAVGYHCHPQTVRGFLKKGKVSGGSYALWMHECPDLKRELENFEVEHHYGIIGRGRHYTWKLKQYTKRVVANKITAPIYISLGYLIRKAVKSDKFYWFYRQAYEATFRRAYRSKTAQLNRI